MDKFQKLAEFNKQYGESFCVKPFIEICNSASGGMKLCCNSEVFIDRSDRNDKTYADIFFNDQRFMDIRKKMLAGERTNVCKKCYFNEKITGNSERIDSSIGLKKYKPDLFQQIIDHSRTELVRMDIKFGNKCNLGCVMCDPGSSSTIGKERKTHGIPTELQTIWSNGSLKNIDQNEFESLKQYAHTITSFTAKGGEPTLLPQFGEWIEFLSDSGHSKNIDFSIVTNATVDMSPLSQKIKTFRHFTICWSIDAVDELFQYVRWPASFDKVSKNQTKIIDAVGNNNNITFGFSVVSHTLNIDQMVRIAEYADSLRVVDYISYGLPNDPAPLDPGMISAKTLEQFKIDVDAYCQGSGKFKDDLKNLYSKVADRFQHYHSDEEELQDGLKKLKAMTEFWKKTRGLDAYDCVPSYKDTISQIK